jgi:hypothetical protein
MHLNNFLDFSFDKSTQVANKITAANLHFIGRCHKKHQLNFGNHNGIKTESSISF